MSNKQSRQRGFFDPISLGFLLAVFGAAGVMNAEEAKEAPQAAKVQNDAQVQVAQPATLFDRRLAAIDLE